MSVPRTYTAVSWVGLGHWQVTALVTVVLVRAELHPVAPLRIQPSPAAHVVHVVGEPAHVAHCAASQLLQDPAPAREYLPAGHRDEVALPAASLLGDVFFSALQEVAAAMPQ
jgi:hypothetical protein